MSGQFNRNNFEQNPSNMKKKHKTKGWATNNNPELCDVDVLSPEDIKAIKEEKWRDRHISKPTKKELKYQNRINVLETSSRKAPLSKKEEKELKRLKKKYKKEYAYRHANHQSNHLGLKCCLSAIVICVVLVFSAILGSYQLYVRPYTGVSLFELVQIYGGLKNSEKIEPSNFDATADANDLLKGLQDVLFLENPIKIQDIMDLIPEFLGGTGDENASVADLLDQANEPVSNGSFTGNEALDKLLASNRFDFSSISTYSPKLEITDKMIGAMLQQVIFYSDNIPLINDFLSPYDLLLRNILRIQHSYIKTNADNSNTLELTLVLQIDSIVNTFIENKLKNPEGTEGTEEDEENKKAIETALKIVKPIIDSVLPEDIAIKLTLTPSQDDAPVLSLAAIKNDSLQKLIYALDKNLAGGKIEEMFNKVGTTLHHYFSRLEEMSGDTITIIGSDKTNNKIGSYSFDFIQTLMSKLDVKNVTSTEFVSMLEHLHAIDNQYQDNFDKYLSDYNIEKSTIEDFYESRDLLFSAYGISKEDAEKFTPETFMDNLNTLPQLINIKDNNFYELSNSALKDMSKLSDKALAQIVNQMINEKAAEMKIGLEIYQLQMLEKSMNIYAAMDVRSFIQKELGDQYASVIDLVMSLFPEKIFVKINLPYERNNASGNPSCDIIFNYLGDSSAATSDAMFKTASALIKSFMDKEYDKNSICRVIDDMIYPLLDEINNTELDFEAKFVKGGIAFDTAYQLLADAVNKGSNPDEKQYTAEEIQQILVNYYTYDEKTQFEKDENGNDVIKDYVDGTRLNTSDGFIKRELQDKFFLAGYITEDTVFDRITSIGSKLTAENINDNIKMNELKSNTKKAEDLNFAISSLEFAKLLVLSKKLETSISTIGFYENFTFVDMSTDGQSLTLVMAGTLSDSITGGSDIIKLENFAATYLVVQATIDLTTYTTDIKINNTDEDGINGLLKLVDKLSGSNGEFNADKIKTDIGKAIQDALLEFENQGMKFEPTSNAIDGKDGFTSTNIYRLISEKSIKGEYQEGDDELLRSIIYKLNNLPKTGLVQSKYVALSGSNGQFTVDSNTYDLIESSEHDANTVNIYDMYFGQQIKQSLTDDYTNIELIKFALFGNNTANINSYKQIVDGLNLVGSNRIPTAEELFPTSERDDKKVKVMFMQFEINRAELGANDLANTVIPEFIYGGAFYDISDPTNAKTYSFINNLTDAEMGYLDRLLAPTEPDSGETGGEDSGETTETISRTATETINQKLENVINSAVATEFTITFGDYTINKKLAELINEFRFSPVIEAGPLYNHCYGMFTYTIPTQPEA